MYTCITYMYNMHMYVVLLKYAKQHCFPRGPRRAQTGVYCFC